MENNENLQKNQEKSVKSDESIILNVLYWVFIVLMLVGFFIGCGFFGMYLFNKNYRYYPVSGTSMQPTINPDAFLYGTDDDKLQDGVYVKLRAPVDYGDIAIIQRPNEEHTIIKRIIAKEGDWISIAVDPQLQYVDNGENYRYHTYVVRANEGYVKMLDESYTDPKDNEEWIKKYPARTESASYYGYENAFYSGYFANPVDLDRIKIVNYNGRPMKFYQLGEGELFYMGDHRSNSGDARNSGIAQESWLVGRVVKIIHNAKTYRDNGTLHWQQFKAMFDYFWDKVADFLSW